MKVLTNIMRQNPSAKKAYRVDRAEDMGLAVAKAIRTAVSGRPGGVYLDIPADTIVQEDAAALINLIWVFIS